MLKHSELNFSFPIRLRSQKQVDEANQMKELIGQDVEIDFVIGYVSLPIEEITNGLVQDSFSKERDLEEVREKGFDICLVESASFGQFICTWNKKTFFQKYDEHMEKLQLYIDQLSEEEGNITIPIEEYEYLREIEEEYYLPKFKKFINLFK